MLNKIIESALNNIDHDFYAFYRLGDIQAPPLDKKDKDTLNRIDDSKVIQLRVIKPEHNNFFIWNYPKEWANHYVSQDFSQIDPVVEKLKNHFNPFIWGEGYFSPQDLDLEEKEQFIKDAQDYNLYQGITVPLGSYRKIEGAITIAFSRNKPISNTAFFAITAHLRNLGNMIFKLQDHREGKLDIPLDEYEELFKFIKDSNHSCTSII